MMVEVVFEEGDQIRRLKGRILEETKDDLFFLHLETEYKTFQINKTKIIKIEKIKENT